MRPLVPNSLCAFARDCFASPVLNLSERNKTLSRKGAKKSESQFSFSVLLIQLCSRALSFVTVREHT